MKTQKGQSFSSSTTALLLFLTFSLSSFSIMADLRSPPISKRKSYIVFVVKPPGQDIKDFAIKILENVLGSQKAAKQSLGYIYRHVGLGFSAALTPLQASLLKKQPGVISIIESKAHYNNSPRPGFWPKATQNEG